MKRLRADITKIIYGMDIYALNLFIERSVEP